jgi:uncharacterized RDD family membrane protein YckC
MDQEKHALVLTGGLLPGFQAAAVWPQVATYFRIDEARLKTDVLDRMPMIVKESEDLDDLETRRAALARIGAASEIHPLRERKYFVLIDNVPRGPLPRAFIDQRLRDGSWPAATRAAAVGTTEWRALDAPPAAAASSAAAAEPEATDTVAAKIARVADSIAGRPVQPRVLPPGAAIHAGFWRRSAAYLIDGLILFLPSLVLAVIPFLGLLLILAGRWLYFALLESSPSQATLGKRAMGLIVTDGKGLRLSFGQASGRYFAGALSYISLYIGYALAGWTQRKQALHDLIADTCVVFDTVKPGEELPSVRPPMPWYGWVANIFLLAVFPVSILAAIALPAYNDYLVRSKIVSALGEVSAAKIEIAESMMIDSACPQRAMPTADPMIESLQLGGRAPDCLITVTFGGGDEVPVPVRNQSIEWLRRSDTEWVCSSLIQSKYLPSACRN